jgi:putative DNA primase/helicase
MPLVDFEGINRAALRNGRSFLKDFIPGGTFRSLDYVVRNPTRDDKHPGSFKINYKTGIWKDFASGHGGGDLISLVAYVRGIGQGEAERELANNLGVPLHKQNGVTSSKPIDGDGRCIITPTVELRAYGTGRADSEVVVPIPADAPATPAEHFELGKSTATWPYRDAAGGALGYVYRFDPPGNKKEFRPLTLGRVNEQAGMALGGLATQAPALRTA